jgi:hypothetical protein
VESGLGELSVLCLTAGGRLFEAITGFVGGQTRVAVLACAPAALARREICCTSVIFEHMTGGGIPIERQYPFHWPAE